MNQHLAIERPLVTVDAVIFSLLEESLQVLLVQRPSGAAEPFPAAWALPGGFIDIGRDADLESCARRKLRAKTGVDVPYLEQLGSWGSAVRDPRGWSATHVYFALLPSSAVALSAGANAADTRWFAIRGQRVHPALAFDHAEILAAAVRRLRAKVEYTSLPVYLMPAEFTLSELQRTYEVILDRPLEKKAFRTRLLAAELLEPSHRTRGGANRPAQLYRIHPRRKPHFFARPFGSAETP
jgi:ADP-ribose pyrophosphatase YjhB (NUDIX family)